MTEAKPNSRYANQQLNFEEYSAGAITLKSLPTVLFVELTQNCNLNCFMCRSAHGYDKELNMDDKIFQIIEKELFPFASIVDLRGYGESTILKDFEKRINQTALLVPKIRLVTNALAINKKLWNLLMQRGANVVVSVDAATRATMTNLGRGDIVKLLASLDIGSMERDRFNNGGDISFNTVVSSVNLEELPDIILLARKYRIGKVTMFPVVAKSDNPLSLENRKFEVAKFLLEAESIARGNQIELRLGASLQEGHVVKEGLPNRCSHPWEYCYIDYSGNVGYCDHLIGHTALMLGNLHNESFEEIWNGEKYQELRKIHSLAKRGGTDQLCSQYSHCNWCYKRRYVDFEDETNPNEKSRIISTIGSNPIINLTDQDVTSTEFLRGRKLPHIEL
jgi:radical SAM protein with 4Fe4S-binding SPASM domain